MFLVKLSDNDAEGCCVDEVDSVVGADCDLDCFCENDPVAVFVRLLFVLVFVCSSEFVPVTFPVADAEREGG